MKLVRTVNSFRLKIQRLSKASGRFRHTIVEEASSLLSKGFKRLEASSTLRVHLPLALAKIFHRLRRR
jgi:hypothetical protein